MKYIALYMPVFHEGYRLFLDKHRDAERLYLFDRQFLAAQDNLNYLKKDIRAVDSQLMAKMLASLGFAWQIVVVKDQADLDQFQLIAQEQDSRWYLTDDDIGRVLAKQYLASSAVDFDPTFLRWDKNLLTSQQDPQPDVKITLADFERQLMTQAFVQAQHSADWWRHVGVLLLKDQQVLLATYNQHLPSEQEAYFNGDPRSFFSSGEMIELTSSIHAEALAIAQAARRGINLSEAVMVVTTFPCPVCAKQIAASGISKLYYLTGYASLDGHKVLKAAGVELCQVVLSEDELQQLAKQERSSSHIKPIYD